MAADKMIVLRGNFETGGGGSLKSYTTGSLAAYTVPTGRELIVKNMRIINNTDTDYTAIIAIGISGGISTTAFPSKTIAARDGFAEDCHIGVMAGENVIGAATNAGLEYIVTCLERDV